MIATYHGRRNGHGSGKLWLIDDGSNGEREH